MLICTECGRENVEGRRFCGGCSAALATACGECGFANEAGESFCGGCGTALTKRTQAERRQLSVMFCDLVSSTELSTGLDPEDLRDVITRYQATTAEIVEDLGGTVAQYLGDGVLVYFGYPTAQEDDARRAVWAGLRIIEGVRTLGIRVPGHGRLRLQVRVGIHTGPVVIGKVGGGAHTEQLAVGETPNVAARVQGQAAAEELLVTEDTRRLLRGAFSTEELSDTTLRGVDRPMVLFRVLGPAAGHRALDEDALVGREEEQRRLSEAWSGAAGGRGRAVLVGGEAGIGKSHLVHDFRSRLAAEEHEWIEGECSPIFQGTDFFLGGHVLRGSLGWDDYDREETRLAKLLAATEAIGADAATVQLVAGALDLALPPEDFPPLPLTPGQRRSRTIEAAVGLILGPVDGQPRVLILEDLHWIDPTSRQLVEQLLASGIENHRLLVLMTARPTEWLEPLDGFERIALRRATPASVREMAVSFAKGRALPDELLDLVAKKTDGVPLFVRELTRSMLESGRLRETGGGYELIGALPELEVPSTLQDSLMSRLDRLGNAKPVAQVASVLGRRFDSRLLAAVTGLGAEVLDVELGRLVDAKLVEPLDDDPGSTYSFTHALVRDAAYGSLLRKRRRELHGNIAEALQGRDSAHDRVLPELLAHHLTAANRPLEAAPYWLAAGQRAMERAAVSEATTHVAKGLEALADAPEGAQRAQLQLELTFSQATMLQGTLGHGAPQVGDAFSRARELSEAVGDTAMLLKVLPGLGQFYITRGDTELATELNARTIALAEEAQNPVVQSHAYRGRGFMLALQGRLRDAMDNIDRAIECLTVDTDPSHQYIVHPLLSAQTWQAMLLSWQGHVDEARRIQHEILERCLADGHPYIVQSAYAYTALLAEVWEDVEAVLEASTEHVALGERFPNPLYGAMGLMHHGWAVARQGNSKGGIEEFLEGLAGFRATGSRATLPMYLGLLGSLYLEAGELDASRQTVDELFDVVEATRERSALPEALRLRAEAAHLEGDHPTAVATAREALALARKQGAVGWELRCAHSLASFTKDHAAATELSTTLDRLHGGQDTPLVVRATALRDDLAETLA